jgi:hypothetical protein
LTLSPTLITKSIFRSWKVWSELVIYNYLKRTMEREEAVNAARMKEDMLAVLE